jgi:hypothetical protein
MVLIESDFHPSWQQVSWMNRETGEVGDHKLVHEPGAVEKFDRQFPVGSRIGMEATGSCQWFVDLVSRLGHEVLIGDAAMHGSRSTTSPGPFPGLFAHHDAFTSNLASPQINIKAFINNID